jgi:hypothetical protein
MFVKGSGVDCASIITPTIARVFTDNIKHFVGRYTVPKSDSNEWKRLTKDEAKILTNNKLQIASIYETTANRAAGGECNGIEDGINAKKEAVYLSMPKFGAIYFAVDYDALPSEYDAIEAYLRAAKNQLGRYKIGVYGSYYIVEEMYKRNVCDYYWQTLAWSDDKLSKNISLYQYMIDKNLHGINVDMNYFYKDAGLWNLTSIDSWQSILNDISENPQEWDIAIDEVVNTLKNNKLGTSCVLVWLPELIQKVDRLEYSGDMKWEDIIAKVSVDSDRWKAAITDISNASETQCELGASGIFKYLPNLIVKIYESNK